MLKLVNTRKGIRMSVSIPWLSATFHAFLSRHWKHFGDSGSGLSFPILGGVPQAMSFGIRDLTLLRHATVEGQRSCTGEGTVLYKAFCHIQQLSLESVNFYCNVTLIICPTCDQSVISGAFCHPKHEQMCVYFWSLLTLANSSSP